MIRLIKALQKNYNTSSYNLFTNVGVKAGQTIPHLHFHVMLRQPKEKTSPFVILNNPKLYKSLLAISPAKLRREIEKIRKVLLVK